MKNIIYIFLVLTTVTFSQTKIERNLGEFSKLAVYDGINVELVKADNWNEEKMANCRKESEGK